MLHATRRDNEALEAFRLSRQICERLAQENPTSTTYQLGLARCHSDIGSLMSDQGRADLSLESHQAALEIEQRLARKFPTDAGYQNSTAGSHNNIANQLWALGRLDLALEDYTRARDPARGWLARTQRSGNFRATWPLATTTSGCCKRRWAAPSSH